MLNSIRLCAAALALSAPVLAAIAESVVFSPDSRYPIYRIPSLIVSKGGVVLAFAEARASRDDHSGNDLALRRSRDGGRTWGPLQVLVDLGSGSVNNPTAVLLPGGRLLMLFNSHPEGFAERQGRPGSTANWIMHSDDEGATWSKPRDISGSTLRPEWPTLAFGPGLAIRTLAGRLVLPANHGPHGDWRGWTALSDDQGQSWRIGGEVPDDGNEAQVVELVGGGLLLNMRGYRGGKFRKISVSRDGGATWSPARDDPALPEPRCQASLVRYSWPGKGSRSRILFSNPASQTARERMTVRLSYDECRTWPVSKLVHPGPSAYSSLYPLRDGAIGLLYEKDGPGVIAFARFDLGWLTDGADKGNR